MKSLTPLVAIQCITYNQAAYIRQCLDGFVMQRTDFAFVAIVHDDCSTDGTDDIVREYAQRYPNIIKPIFETENQYSKGDGSLSRIMTQACNNTGAKYIAMCEGDDYWTDPLKLQKQVDFLENHPECSLCYHMFIHVDSNGNELADANSKLIFTPTCSLLQIFNHAPFQTATIMVRNELFASPTYVSLKKCNFPFGDILVFISATKLGTLCGINEPMSAYRHHEMGVSHKLGSAKSLILSTKGWFFAATLFDNDFFNFIHSKIIINNILTGLIYHPKNRISFIKLLLQGILLYPKSCILFVTNFYIRVKSWAINRLPKFKHKL